MISIGKVFVTIGTSIFLSILSYFMLTEGMRPENGASDPLNYGLLFSAQLALVILNILIIALAVMKVDIPKNNQKQNNDHGK